MAKTKPTDKKKGGKEEVLRVSPSTISAADGCEACLWLGLRGVGPPDTPFPGALLQIDSALKRFMKGLKGELPGWLRELGFEGRLLGPAQFGAVDPKTGILVSGRFDELLETPSGAVRIIDWKSGYAKEERADLYAPQMDGYHWLLERNGRRVEGVDLVFTEIVPGDRVSERLFPFQAKRITVPTRPSRTEARLRKIIEVLALDEPPEPRPECGVCDYRRRAREAGL